MALAHSMIATEDAANFDKHLQSNHRWLQIRAGYASFVSSFVDSFLESAKMLRGVFEAAPAAHLDSLGIDATLSTTGRMLAFAKSEFNTMCSLYVLTLATAESIGRGDDQATQGAIFDSYNGLAKPYIDAMSNAFILPMSRRDQPHRNDLYDQDHFAYLEPNTLLVTEDKGMRRLASSIGVQAVSSVEFRERAHAVAAERTGE
jgi:hypothetical protein